MERAWRPLRWSGLLLAWIALAWLCFRVPAGPPDESASAWAWMGAALLCAWMLPGWLLWVALGRRGGAVEAAAFSFGLGLAFLLVLASGVLLAHANLAALGAAVTVGTLLLGAAALAAGARRGPGRRPDRRALTPGAWAAIGLALSALLAVAMRTRGFTFGGDEWFYLRAARVFLEADALSSTLLFDAWNLVLALLVRLAGVDLVLAHRVLLTPFLVCGAALAHLALARAVLRSAGAVALAFVLLALQCLSDMHTRGEGAGMALLARIAEDKYAGLLIATPLALAALLHFARGARRGWLLAFVALSLAAVVLQPLALFWIGLPALGVLTHPPLRRRWRMNGWAAAAMAALVAAALALAWGLRSLRENDAFVLYNPGWPFNAQLLRLAHRQLLILSLPRGWFMAHAALLAHPLTVAALAATLRLVPRFHRSLSARFLVSAMALPLALAYNPVSATWLGGWIMPWMVPRLLWPLPVSLVLAATLHEAAAALEGRLARRQRWLPSTATWAALAALTALLLEPRIARSLRALDARNRVFVSEGERDLMRFLSARTDLKGMVLGPTGVTVRLSAWTSHVLGCPGMDAVRSPGDHVLERDDCHRLLKARHVDDAYVAALSRRGIAYVVAPNGSSLDRVLSPLAAFEPLYRGPEYSFFAWRPERWPPSNPAIIPAR